MSQWDDDEDDTGGVPAARSGGGGGDRPELPQYPTADPWAALSYIASGVLLWGLLGWGAARWLDIPALLGVGLVIGGALGTLLVYLRYGRPQSGRRPR